MLRGEKLTMDLSSFLWASHAAYLSGAPRSIVYLIRVPTRRGKPGKMRVHLENLEISWNFEKINKYHGKMT